MKVAASRAEIRLQHATPELRETIAAGLQRAERALDRASALWRERGARGREVLREYRDAIAGARRERRNALRMLATVPEAV